MQYVYTALAVAAGILIPLQTGFNTQLGRAVGSAWTASAMVMIVAMLSMGASGNRRTGTSADDWAAASRAPDGLARRLVWCNLCARADPARPEIGGG